MINSWADGAAVVEMILDGMSAIQKINEGQPSRSR
jgi:hypothetical protein